MEPTLIKVVRKVINLVENALNCVHILKKSTTKCVKCVIVVIKTLDIKISSVSRC